MDMSQKYTETLKNNFKDTLKDEAIKSGDYTAMLQLDKEIDIQEDLTGESDEIKEQMVQNFLNEEEDLTGEDEVNETEEEPTVRRSDRDRARRKPYSAKARFRAGLNEEEDLTGEVEEEMDEQTGASSSGAYSQPAIWAKNKKNWRLAQKPTYGGKGSKFVTVKNKCKTFPYCNQGDINALNIFSESLNETVKNISKKIGKPYDYVAKLVMETMGNSSLGKKMTEKLKDQMKDEKQKRYTKKELEEIISRSFYKSPVTDPKAGIVGVSKMNLPIGQMFTMSGNKPKYEA